jgi:hypothetical protein
VRRPVLSQDTPAIADVDAAKRQAKQHGRGVDHIEHEGRALAIDGAIVEAQHLIDVAELQVKQGEVPKIVHGEKSIGPRARLGSKPGDALGRAVLHLHHVCDRVPAPSPTFVERHARASQSFGTRVVAALLEPERVHAKNRRIARHCFAPSRKHPREAISQHARVPGQEVDQMTGLQRQRIARVRGVHVLEDPTCVAEAALDNVPNRFEMAALAIVDVKDIGAPKAVTGNAQARRLGPEQK